MDTNNRHDHTVSSPYHARHEDIPEEIPNEHVVIQSKKDDNSYMNFTDNQEFHDEPKFIENENFRPHHFTIEEEIEIDSQIEQKINNKSQEIKLPVRGRSRSVREVNNNLPSFQTR